ncbi:Ca-transporting ATPase [Dacryopinax primogenitus]|uniref:Cation-transporting ATPase n=1 Tax=Dacryopinax primogenitus (strain DJM 731) TaxID=1858805 RepID=M5G1G8_DACPD|nr:Ca-transporting ATPase [Dacryopinax primogenitus]EJU04071.1 Ca-transporting ATPase [Dacryopinax primogenitus]
MYDEHEPSLPPPPGPPSRQSTYIADEDTTMRFTGYEPVPWKAWLWFFGCILTLGGLVLIGRWLPGLWLRFVCKEKGFKDAENGVIVVENPFTDIFLTKVENIEYPYPSDTVFNILSSSPSTVRPSGANTPTPHNKTPVNGPTPSAEILAELNMAEYRYSRFVLNPTSGLFMMLSKWRDPSWKSVKAVQAGLSSAVREQRQILFGANVIDVKGKSIGALLIDEVLHPFYVFQVASIILWSIDDYYYYAFCIALISLISITTTLIETKRTIERMREMSRFSCPVSVLSDGFWKVVDSSDLVPGDIVDLMNPALAVFPADILLLSGDAIVNESMLTGESVPVSKIPVKDTTIVSWREGQDIDSNMAKSFLYTGTRVIRLRPGNLGEQNQAFGLVVRTGFNTTKGALIRSMLFPKPMGFKFYRDSMRFIGVLACIAGLGFAASSVKFIELGVPWSTMCVRALDLITIVVPPALPATLSVGTSFAIGRLRKLGIFCISPNRVNVAGKINVVCFDKTGTLTEDGLDVLGVRTIDRSSGVFGELSTDGVDFPLGSGKATLQYALATCHALKSIDGEILGDPLDVKMFEWTGWTLEEGKPTGNGTKKGDGQPNHNRPAALVQTVVRPPGSVQFKLEDALKPGKHAHFLELGVIRVFEFVSSLRRMSVIVKRLKSSSMEIYVKGAPEVMVDICEKDSFPADYEDLLAYYTKNGFRVIALAGRSIEGLSWLKAQRMKREQAEAGLRFLGLIIFENKLKPGTTPAIQVLRSAHLGIRMVTGDNARTAISVARECGLVNVSAHVFYPTFTYGDSQTPDATLAWSSVDDEDLKLDEYSLKPLTPPHHHTVEDEIAYQDYSMAVTGDVFKWMVNYAPLETLQRMLVKAQVYARMSPDEKHELVERLQSLGYTVAFCGDGANDCGALKAADVGLSLSEAEASVAAPFTSRIPDISCMIEVIKEGRAALVTSFSCFKYMALYSIIQFTSITLLYSFASTLGDFQFLYIDLFIIIPVAVAMGRTLPFPNIHPKRPTASLVSKKVLASIIGQIIFTSGFQFWAFFWVRRQPWYEPPDTDPHDHTGLDFETRNYENTALFLVSSFQYIFIAAVFSIGPPYRKQIYTNVFLMLCLVALTGFSTFVLLDPPTALSLLLDLVPLPTSGKLTILLAAVLNVLVCWSFEEWGARQVSDLIGFVRRNMRSQSAARRVKEGKAYKAVEGGMRRSPTE